MQTFPKIQSEKPLSNLQLLVTFQNQIKKIYDCSHLLAREHFKPLQDNVLFKTVYVDHGGYGIIWNDDLDLAESELWINGQIAEQVDGAAL